ncbi:hypothetical protein [Aquimarina sp. AD10]|nr:hypothetical protein [Aquimarina sp. AD10]
MNLRKTIAILFMSVTPVFGAVFYLGIGYPEDFESYFENSFL